MKKVEKYLNKLISEALWGGSTDPGAGDLYSATYAFLVLKELGLKVKNEKYTVKILTKENVYDHNYIEDLK